MATWPASLPTNFLKNSLNEAFAKNTISSPMSVGPPKVRKRASAAPEPFSGQMYLTDAQAAVFYTFYNTTLNSGVDSFDGFDHPRTGNSSDDWMVSPDTIPTLTSKGFGWILDLSLDLLP